MFKQLIYLISFLSLVAVLPAGATETEKDQRKFDYFFYGGLNLKNAGKFDAAYDAFNHCLEIDSTAAPVLYELSSFSFNVWRLSYCFLPFAKAITTFANPFSLIYRRVGTMVNPGSAEVRSSLRSSFFVSNNLRSRRAE